MIDVGEEIRCMLVSQGNLIVVSENKVTAVRMSDNTTIRDPIAIEDGEFAIPGKEEG